MAFCPVAGCPMHPMPFFLVLPGRWPGPARALSRELLPLSARGWHAYCPWRTAGRAVARQDGVVDSSVDRDRLGRQGGPEPALAAPIVCRHRQERFPFAPDRASRGLDRAKTHPHNLDLHCVKKEGRPARHHCGCIIDSGFPGPVVPGLSRLVCSLRPNMEDRRLPSIAGAFARPYMHARGVGGRWRAMHECVAYKFPGTNEREARLRINMRADLPYCSSQRVT